MQTRHVNMQRWSITSQKPFDAVDAAVEQQIGKPNMVEFVAKMTAAAGYEEMQKAVHDSVSEIGLMQFMRLDHGAVLVKAGVGGGPKSVRLILGNPLIMQSMARFSPLTRGLTLSTTCPTTSETRRTCDRWRNIKIRRQTRFGVATQTLANGLGPSLVPGELNPPFRSAVRASCSCLCACFSKVSFHRTRKIDKAIRHKV